MKHCASILWLSTLLLLSGVWGRKNHRFAFKSDFRCNFRSTTPGPERVSNWQFSTTSTVSGTPSLTIAGEYQSIRRFGKRRSACRRFELF